MVETARLSCPPRTISLQNTAICDSRIPVHEKTHVGSYTYDHRRLNAMTEYCRLYAFIVFLGLLWSMSAQAAQYDNEDLGKAMPMWTENFPDLNHAGDAVWTGWDGHLGATAWFLSGDRSQKIQLPALYTNSGAWARAFALSIRNEYPTNSCKSFSAGCDVWAIGSSSSSARMLDRRAVAWHIGKIDTTNGTLLAPGTLDLHAMAGGSERVSAAYGLTSVWGQSGHAYIAGFVRERVANDRLAVPTTWFANVGGAVPSITATALGTPAGGQPYGMATGVASVHKSGGKLLICGTVGVSGSYAHALLLGKVR